MHRSTLSARPQDEPVGERLQLRLGNRARACRAVDAEDAFRLSREAGDNRRQAIEIGAGMASIADVENVWPEPRDDGAELRRGASQRAQLILPRRDSRIVDARADEIHTRRA